MITFEQLNQQNHRITELTNVLTHLLGDRSLCDSEITADLFFRYVEEVKKHLEIADNNLYSQLLTHQDRRVQNTANRFMSGSQEIKRIFGQYLHKWCRPRSRELVVREHEQFVRETQEMFRMVLDRLQDETEQLYPVIREVTGSRQAVA